MATPEEIEHLQSHLPKGLYNDLLQVHSINRSIKCRQIDEFGDMEHLCPFETFDDYLSALIDRGVFILAPDYVVFVTATESTYYSNGQEIL